jgi:hypothetical protein
MKEGYALTPRENCILTALFIWNKSPGPMKLLFASRPFLVPEKLTEETMDHPPMNPDKFICGKEPETCIGFGPF